MCGNGASSIRNALRSKCSSLFEFDDVPPDLPAGLNLKCIDGTQHLLASLADQFT
ncbi:hypothetical protein [Pseudomonas sp. FG-3G]|nr:hypothetical protein [Pseudomonas sp. FG-3G]